VKRYLIDTNVISELRKQERCNANVWKWFAEVNDQDIFLSVLVIGELRCGIERIRRKDPKAAFHLDKWLQEVVDNYSDRIFPVTQEIAEASGIMNVPDPVSTVDGLLAATAKIHNCTLVTRNEKDICKCGVAFYNPFE
jgi:toxin FitB